MSKTVTSAVVLSVICSVGFILGFLFNDIYQAEKRDLIASTISQHSEVQELFGWYSLILNSEFTLKDLETVTTLEDVDALKQKAKDHGKMHIKLFREKMQKIKKEAVNPEALYELEKSVNEIENVFN
jgi:hypothetical protein